MSDEIERKWMATKHRGYNAFTRNLVPIELVQYYTKIDDNSEVRMRQEGEVYFHTEKFGNGIKRPEQNTPITSEEFNEGCKNMVGHIISKFRYKFRICDGKYTVEVDDYLLPLFLGHVIIEIEFETVEEAEKFNIKEALDIKRGIFSNFVDVTNDKRYKNKNIALNGFPPLEKETGGK